MQFTLQAPGLNSLVLTDDPYQVYYYDPGAPSPREVVEDAPAADGVLDTTTLEGERTITLGVAVVPQTFAAVQALKAFTRQDLRPTLTIEFAGAPDLVATGRLVPFGDPFNDTDFAADRRLVEVQMRVQAGILESSTLHEATIVPGADTTGGLEFGTTLEFGSALEFPLVDPPGTSVLSNAGDRAALPIIRLFGPFGDEGNASDETEIANVTTGKSLVFAGTAVAAGDYLEVNFRAKTILLNGVSTQSKYDRLVFPDSSWWTLRPGENEIAFRPDTFSGNAQMLVLWRDAYS